MKRENFHPEGIQNALAQIIAYEHQAMAGGNVDSEKSSFENIIQNLKLQLISPEEALLQAQKIVEGRQDYH